MLVLFVLVNRRGIRGCVCSCKYRGLKTVCECDKKITSLHPPPGKALLDTEYAIVYLMLGLVVGLHLMLLVMMMTMMIMLHMVAGSLVASGFVHAMFKAIMHLIYCLWFTPLFCCSATTLSLPFGWLGLDAECVLISSINEWGSGLWVGLKPAD